MQEYVDRKGLDNPDEIFAVAYELATKYGEGAAAAACDMYDAIAEAQGVNVPPAEPAKTPTMQEVKDVVGYHLEKTPNDVPAATGKLVKKTATRTMRKNAARDDAKMALVPSGDGCVFCKMLGSRGWEDARSSKSFEAHLHAHCRCEYVVRFGNNLHVAGYDPEALLKEFNDTGESKWKDKVKAVRRQDEAKNKISNNNKKGANNNTKKGNSDIIASSKIDVASARRFASSEERAKIINEAINAPLPVYADDLRIAYRNVPPKEGYQDIVLHGSQNYTEYEHKYILDTETLSYIISGRRDYKGDDIRLLSCSTGKADKDGNCVASDLANLLGVNVFAPIDVLTIHLDGSMSVGNGRNRLYGEDGFRIFRPIPKE